MTNETSSLEDGEEELGFSVAECREWLEADVLAGLQEVRELCMDSARTLGAKMKEDDADLVRLNAALVKAARAVRQTSVLQLEVAGLRRQAGTREPAAANTNQPHHARRSGGSGYGTYERFGDDEQLEEQRRVRSAANRELDEACNKLHTAMNADLKAAGRLLEPHQSVETKAQHYIRHIPHPETDACLRTLGRTLVDCLFGAENIEPPTLKTGPPDTPTKWIADSLSPEVLEKEMQRKGYA